MKEKNTKTVTVFCASSDNLSEQIKLLSARFAELLAKKNCHMIYGGTSTGLMGTIANAYKEAGGHLIGIVPEYFIKRGEKYSLLDETHYVSSVSERKQMMVKLSDALIMLPGGIGTYDEFFDALARKQLGQCVASIYIFNACGFYDKFLEMLAYGVENGAITSETMQLFKVFDSPEKLAEDITLKQ